MNAGFFLYGALTVIAALQTVRHARARRFELHRGWAIRLFALVIGSWLYRMDYGFWHLLAHAAGHTHSFDGPFDVVMDFFFFVPNLIVAEAFVRARSLQAGAGLRIGASVLLSAAALFVAVASYLLHGLSLGTGHHQAAVLTMEQALAASRSPDEPPRSALGADRGGDIRVFLAVPHVTAFMRATGCHDLLCSEGNGPFDQRQESGPRNQDAAKNPAIHGTAGFFIL